MSTHLVIYSIYGTVKYTRYIVIVCLELELYGQHVLADTLTGRDDRIRLV